MARKILISFLGTNDYVNCNYYLEENRNARAENVKYVQEAILQFHEKEWTKNDVCYFFLTKDARTRNWEDDQQFNRETRKYDKPNKGLDSRLQLFNEKVEFKGVIKTEDIPEGFSSDEIWTIFQKILDKIQEGDIIYLDITHAFRSLPMLGMVILNYLKALHNVETKAIYYGAFEKLGFASQVEKMPLKERNAPVLNLVSFSILQDWTNAAHNFIADGKVTNFIELTKKEINPLLRSKSNQKAVAIKINNFVKSLDQVVNSLMTNRGMDIVEGKIFRTLLMNTEAISDELFIAPMKPLMSKVSDKVKDFSRDEDWKNGLHAVKWCIDHNMVQQGITMLQETVITYYCLTNGLNFKDQNDRDLINTCFYIKGMNIESDKAKWNPIARKNEEKVNKILSELNKEVTDDFQSLSQSARNDINHGGFTRYTSPDNLKKKLVNSFELISLCLNPVL